MSSTSTSIEWTDKTWNPSTGCNKVSQGCKNCYALTMTERFPNAFPNGFEFTMKPERLNEPKKWRKPSMIFVNSMSDLFHEKMTDEFLDQVFETMEATPHHTYQILTKRPKRMLEYTKHKKISNHIWLGTSVENQKAADERIDLLRQVPANVRFLSCEPLLEAVKLDLQGIHWVIVGGESGRGARPMSLDWALDIAEQCKKAKAAFFFKQQSEASAGRARYKDISGLDTRLQRRDFPLFV